VFASEVTRHLASRMDCYESLLHEHGGLDDNEYHAR
jgi:hypothetical protein